MGPATYVVGHRAAETGVLRFEGIGSAKSGSKFDVGGSSLVRLGRANGLEGGGGREQNLLFGLHRRAEEARCGVRTSGRTFRRRLLQSVRNMRQKGVAKAKGGSGSVPRPLPSHLEITCEC